MLYEYECHVIWKCEENRQLIQFMDIYIYVESMFIDTCLQDAVHIWVNLL